MATIAQILKQSAEYLDETRPGEILLAFVLNQSRAYLYTYPEKSLKDNDIKLFENLIKRYEQGEPIAYIIGKKEFYSFEFVVTKDTLIPRPETEILVDEALKIIGDKPCKVLELGIGSGCVAITIAKLKPQIHMLATDISEAALTVAQKNARNLEVTNIDFILSNWYQNIPQEKFDLIISNPPYIAEDDPHLTDLKFEPKSALVADDHGLKDLQHIIMHAKDYLKEGGWLLLEHGYNQKEAVDMLLNANQYCHVKTLKDLAELPRVSLGQMKC